MIKRAHLSYETLAYIDEDVKKAVLGVGGFIPDNRDSPSTEYSIAIEYFDVMFPVLDGEIRQPFIEYNGVEWIAGFRYCIDPYNEGWSLDNNETNSADTLELAICEAILRKSGSSIQKVLAETEKFSN